VVEVQVRQQNMAHVGSAKAKRLDLRQRRHVCVGRIDTHCSTEQRTEPARIPDVMYADAGIDQHQAVRVSFDQQAMRHQPGTRQEAAFTVDGAPTAGAHRAAIQVMDAHT